MFKKIHLFHEIQEFYKTFNLEVRIHKASDITTDNLHYVLFDIREILYANARCASKDSYEICLWLDDLKKQISKFREHKHRPYIAITLIVMAVAMLCGCVMGRHQTIRQAELINATDDEYHIIFGDEIHAYTFE